MAVISWHSRVPFIPQMEGVECGAASLAMVLAAHGHYVPLPEVREACGVSRDGASAHAIVRAARDYGLDAEGVSVGVEELASLPLPAILHWDFRHFVVLERIGTRGACIVDPGLGRLTVDSLELRRKFTGVAIAMTPGDSFLTRPARRPTIARYRTLLGDVLPSLALVVTASLLLHIPAAVLPVGIQFLVDRVIMPQHEPWLWALGLGLAGSVLGRALLALVRGWVLQATQLAMDAALMATFLEHLLHLPLSFFLQRKVGDLAQRVQAATVVREVLSTRALSTLLDGLQLVVYAALMFAYDSCLAAAVTGLGLVRVALILFLRSYKRQLVTAEQAALGRESSALVEAFASIETTKACQAEAMVFARWADRTVERINRGLERARVDIASEHVMSFLQGAALALVFLVGGQAVVEERMTFGTFSSFLILQGLFLGPLESLLATVDQLQYVGNQLLRVDDVLETRREVSGSLAPSRLQGHIVLADVSFAYSPGSQPTLRDISLEIRAGEKVALVGPSGAGKSTLARLLLGMHQPSKGRILLDGRDLRELNLAVIRRQMGVVLQETFLFDDTVRANLCLNDPGLPLERLRAAASRACISEVIDALPLGYDTPIGENGRRLSGGERQRLALARALVSNPSLLLLDEATSALDLDTEARVHGNLAALGCTRVVIAHRLATVQDADRIIVVAAGRIVQIGRYQRLVEEPGLFREIVAAMDRSMAAPA